ncbi:hypothetical protein [Paenibacillus sp. FSL R7-277]|uniref:hypothetical protein n=1 Tax=Paenibacillus sp. FSL R7-277 TaxID=1227352 RepID=UPI001F396260|nr:hypothetical protein [Paenibacillus sp. FSL R7-277]
MARTSSGPDVIEKPITMEPGAARGPMKSINAFDFAGIRRIPPKSGNPSRP